MSYKLSPWSLTDLFPGIDAPELEAAFKDLEKQINIFEKYRHELKADVASNSLLKIIRDLEALTELANRLSAFASLTFAANTQDQSTIALLGRIRQCMAEMENRTLFFSLWWKELDDINAERLSAVSGDYRYFLESIRHFKPHTLSEAEEKVVNLKNVTGFHALITLYDAITNRYVFTMDVDGKRKEMTRGELSVYIRGADPTLRAKAYQELYRVYGADGSILGQMYQTAVRDWHNENLSLRKYPSPIAARNLGNDVPDEAVDVLLKVCEKNTEMFQRYFRLKAKCLKIPNLSRYDIYAPLIKSDKTYEFDQAAGVVLESFTAFNPEFGKLAKRVFDANHLDSEIRKGKQSGAFCDSVTPEMTPWVKLNYQGRADDVATMAHELGHAIHSMLASRHSAFTFQSSLPLAETASTFGEMMLVDRLLAEENDVSVRRDMLFRQIDDAYATILRQAYFAIFEKQAHEKVAQNSTVDELSVAYMENLKKQFGEAVEVSDEFRWEWVSIPHIYHTPFYVYAYAFGQLLVFSLYQQYKAEGETFKPRYLKILSAGGSEAPAKILAEAGIDIRSEKFWQGGFGVINGLIGQLEKI